MPFQKGNKYGNRFSSTNQPDSKVVKRKKSSIYGLLKERYENLSKEDFVEMSNFLMQCTREEFKDIAENKETPMWVINMISALKNDIDKGQTDTIERLWDRQWGKAKNSMEITGAEGKDLIPQRPLTKEELKELHRQLEEE